MQVKFLPSAHHDLEEIGDWYYRQGGQTLAHTMIQRIKRKTALLKDNPYLAPEYHQNPQYRRLVVAEGLFILFYRVTEAVEILHIRRSEQREWNTLNQPQ